MVGFTRDRVGAVVVAVVAASVATARADTIFVDDDAPLGGDGLSWETAFNDLQDAIAAAGPGDELWIETPGGGGFGSPD